MFVFFVAPTKKPEKDDSRTPNTHQKTQSFYLSQRTFEVDEFDGTETAKDVENVENEGMKEDEKSLEVGRQQM